MQITWPHALLSLFFVVAGVLHFIFPNQYVSVMPQWLPWHAELVALSGICEIAGGLGILFPMTRMAAGLGLILLCVAVLPANIQMLLDAQEASKASWIIAVLWLRLPLQLLLVMWIWKVARRRCNAI